MHSNTRSHPSIFGLSWSPVNVALTILLTLLFFVFLFLFMTLTAQQVQAQAQAQTYTIIHNFTGGPDGANPYAGLTMDRAGNLYGTTCGTLCYGGVPTVGTVFRLLKKGSGWVFTTLYSFRGGADGAGPWARVIIGPDGSLYGTTYLGGGAGCGGTGCGTVFNLKPPASIPPAVFGGWNERVLYSFQGGSDGAYPIGGDLALDNAGNLYGTTAEGGSSNAGTVFELTPSVGAWSETVLHSFSGGDGNDPVGGLILDDVGNLYGTTLFGGYGGCTWGQGCGTVYMLSPSASGWTETVLHYFQGGSDGENPVGGLTQGPYGTIGTTSLSGTNGGGTAFILNNQLFLYSFPGTWMASPFPGPWSSLTYAPSGAPGVAYGTTFGDGYYYYGTAFYMYGCAGWNAETLHDFTGGTDGGWPVSNLIFDTDGNLFGTTSVGGTYGYGVVFEITVAESSNIALLDSSECMKPMVH